MLVSARYSRRMDDLKIKKFMALGGQAAAVRFDTGDSERRKLGAQLLLSEVLEYVVRGLGIVPEFNGVRLSEPNSLTYHDAGRGADKLEMVDGLADVAYTMYWNSLAFGIPLEEAFDLVCDNNLEKFVKLQNWKEGPGALERESWDCGVGIAWPEEVVQVEVLQFGAEFYAVGKDRNGKVRKPSNFKAVDLSRLLC